MATTSYDLLIEPWIPVSTGQETTRVGLLDLFLRAHEFDDLAVPVPPAASGLWRILYAITARVTGLDAVDGWADRQADLLKKGAFDRDRVAAYFDRYPGSFDLFHPDRPWLQDPRLSSQCPKSSGINKLVVDRPAGNTQVWFGHYTDTDPVPLPAAEAAWYLIAQLYYGASGRCTTRDVGGQKLSNSNAGPLRAAMSYHPLGRTLFESLILGVPPAHTANDDEEDLCPWEQATLPDPLGPTSRTTWPARLLTGRFQHAILLVPDSTGRNVIDSYVTWGTRQPATPARDPYVVLKQSKQGTWYQLPAEGRRALWRDVYALLQDTPETRRPAIIGSAGEHDHERTLRIRAYGFDQDGQAKDRQWFTSVTPPILRWLDKYDEDAAYGSVALHTAAEQTCRDLVYLLKRAWVEATNTDPKDSGPWVRPAENYYWSRAEKLFWQHLNDRTWDSAEKAYRRLGHEAIDHATASAAHRPRVAEAVDRAHRRLGAGRQGGGA